MAHKIGRVLYELHLHRQRDVNNEVFGDWCSTIRKKGQGYLERMTCVDLKDEFSKALDAYIKNPGAWCYMHGDANSGNYFVDPETGTVTLVDLNSMVQYVDAENRPQGYPGYEYYQMISSLYWQEHFHGFDSTIVARAIAGFISGYQDHANIITPEAHRFFNLYWSIRLALCKPDSKLTLLI